MAVDDTSNAITSQPRPARNTGSLPMPQPTTSTRRPGPTTARSAADVVHSVRCGLACPSSQGTTAVPACASAYSVSNQPAGSPDAAASAASCRARRRIRSSDLTALAYAPGRGTPPGASAMSPGLRFSRLDPKTAIRYAENARLLL